MSAASERAAAAEGEQLARTLAVLRETSDRPLSFGAAGAFAALDEGGSEPLAADAESGTVIPANGLVLLYGDGGAGKTTLVLDMLVHLASGEPWLELVMPARPLRICLVENEGPRQLFRKKLARKLAKWPRAAETIRVLEEPWQGVSFRDEAQRDEFVEFVTAQKIDLLVAAPIARLGMQGGGTLDEVAEFADLVADVQRRAPGLAAMLVHHPNRAGQVSGAWEGFPDTTMHVQASGHGRTRILWQKLRWSSLLHGKTTHLLWADGESFTVDEREAVTASTMVDEILAAVLESPGASWTKLRPRVRGNETEKAAVRDRLIADGLLVNQTAREGQFRLWHADDPAATRSELRTGLERLPFPTPEREAAAVPVPPFQRSIGTVERERHGRPGSLVADCLICDHPFSVDDGSPAMRCRACVALTADLVTEREADQMRLLERLRVREALRGAA